MAKSNMCNMYPNVSLQLCRIGIKASFIRLVIHWTAANKGILRATGAIWHSFFYSLMLILLLVQLNKAQEFPVDWSGVYVCVCVFSLFTF